LDTAKRRGERDKRRGRLTMCFKVDGERVSLP
jgi:hypothetical protein